MTAAVQPTNLQQAVAVGRYELRRLLGARHSLMRLGVLMIPVLMALVVAAARIVFGRHEASGGLPEATLAADQTALAMLFRIGHLRWIVFLSAAGLFGGLFSGERADRTLHHLFLQPASRATLTLGKYAGAVLLLWPVALVSWILTTVIWLLPHGLGTALGAVLSLQGLGDFLAYAVILLLATVAYGGLFTLAGAVFRSPPIIALAILGWEGLASFLPVAFQRFTVYYWLDSLLPTRVPLPSVLKVLAEPAPWPACVLVCLAIGAAAVATATWRARNMELSYGAAD
jgi:ABC-type transport system involved in multi-copper enzyme maturation permease subunit